MKKILKIIWIIIFLLVVIYGIILWRRHVNVYKNGIKIDVNDYDLTVSVKKIETDVQIADKYYAKVLLKIRNYKSTKTELLGVKYQLVDEDGNELSNCVDEELDSNKYDDIVSNNVAGKSTNEGYLYCLFMGSNFSKLKISVLDGNKQLDDGTYEFYFKDYYINLDGKMPS